jgi:glycerol-1-phosphate dehydrogenase [NAD(P)+]
MTSLAELRTIDDVRTLLESADPDQRLVPCEIADLRLGGDAISAVRSALHELVPPGTKTSELNVVLLVDATPILRAGADLKALVETQLQEDFRVRREVLSDGHSELHVSEDVVDAAKRVTADADAVVALGGGTISDIGKLAAARAGGFPLVVVQTAASVDGYTDNVSVLLRDGVKRTTPSRWPDVVIADSEVISGAPARMNRAGYGEMTSMFTAPADWRLASLLQLDSSFHRAPIALLQAIGADIDAWSPGLGRGDLAATERLTWALAVRGIATGVAGTTACLSGVEHLVSHMLDLHRGERHLPMGLHGAQVGVATVLAAAAWEMCFERIAANGPPRITRSALDEVAARERIDQAFGDLDPTGRIAAECWTDYSRKLQTCHQQIDGMNRVLQAWPEHEPELRALLRPAATVGRGLRAANAAATFAELEPAVEPELGRWAVQNCALMRNRFTVVDLLTIAGWWTPDDVAELIQRSERAGLDDPAGQDTPGGEAHRVG